MSSDHSLKYSAILAMGGLSPGFTIIQTGNSNNFVIESVGNDVNVISTTPNYVGKILPGDTVVGIALFSTAKNGFYSIKISSFKETKAPATGSLIRLDLRRNLSSIVDTSVLTEGNVSRILPTDVKSVENLMKFHQIMIMSDRSTFHEDSPNNVQTTSLSSSKSSVIESPTQCESDVSDQENFLVPNRDDLFDKGARHIETNHTLHLVPETHETDEITQKTDEKDHLTLPSEHEHENESESDPQSEMFELLEDEVLRLKAELRRHVPENKYKYVLSENRELKRQLEDVTERLRASNLTVQKLMTQTKDQEHLKTELAMSKYDLKSMKDQLDSYVLKDDYRSLEMKYKSLEHQNELLTKRCNSTESHLNYSNKRLDEAMQRIHTYQELVDEYKSQLATLHEELDEKDEELLAKASSITACF